MAGFQRVVLQCYPGLYDSVNPACAAVLPGVVWQCCRELYNSVNPGCVAVLPGVVWQYLPRVVLQCYSMLYDRVIRY